MMMDDGGVDVPVSGGLWRQSLALVSGSPPELRFQHIGPLSPAPRTWAQIGTNPDNDQGPLGPYYTSGFTEVRGVFYATQQNDWDWLDNGLFTMNGTELVERGEQRWDSARGAWNLAVDQAPAVVARPGSADEIAAVVRYARGSGLRVAVQAEGHSAGPLAGVGEDTLLLKTGRMAGAEVDVENRRARVGAAAKWQDVSALASPRGLAGLSGSSAEVGVVGYTLGGGHGWLAREHGLACNSVVGAEVVTAD